MIRYSEENSVSYIGFESRYNALDMATLDEFISLLDKLKQSENIKAVVIYGVGGRFFCTGANPEEIKKNKTTADFKNFCRLFTNMLEKITVLPQPTIAKVSGKSAGSGVAIACACDLNIGLKDCLFRMSEVLFGFDPMIVIEPLRKKMGDAFARQMILSPGTFFDSDWALNSGLLDRVSTSEDSLERETAGIISDVFRYNQSAIQTWKNETRHLPAPALVETRIQTTAEIMKSVSNNLKPI